MSISTGTAGTVASREAPGLIAVRLRSYFADSPARTVQSVLGLLWLLDGGLQFQSFMYSRAFTSSIKAQAAGQPGWLHDSLIWGANIAARDLTVWNTLFALIQVAIGAGLLYRRTVKPAIVLCIAWSLYVWWFGEAFGMLFMSMAQPLTGAPGGVILYALVALIAWPTGRPGGLLGVRGARLAWAALWLLMAWLWLEAPSAAPGAVTSMINGAPSGMSWLSSVQEWVATAVRGDGVAVAVVLAAASAAIGVAVARNWRAREFILLAVVLNVAYWVVGQGLGGIFAGGATDPNSAPLFILLAYALYSLVPS